MYVSSHTLPHPGGHSLYLIAPDIHVIFLTCAAQTFAMLSEAHSLLLPHVRQQGSAGRALQPAADADDVPPAESMGPRHQVLQVTAARCGLHARAQI